MKYGHHFSDTVVSLAGGATLLCAAMYERLASGGLDAAFIGACGAAGALLTKELYRRYLNLKKQDPHEDA